MSDHQPEDVERVARAIYATASGAERPCFDREPESVKRFYFCQARAALSALPREGGSDEVTPEMVKEGLTVVVNIGLRKIINSEHPWPDLVTAIYQAMHRARPK